MYPRRLCSCDQVPSSGPMYVHAGLEGSVIALTNVLGELVEKYRYTAFGLLTVLDAEGEEKATPALSPWLYHGRLFEEASGLYWMRMRHYSPQLGRFLQPDPAGIAGGINLYVYSNNNPLRFFDPWGLWPPNTAAGDNDGEHGEADPEKEKRKRLAIIGDDGDEEVLKANRRYVERKIKKEYYEDYITAKDLDDAIAQLEALGATWEQLDFYGHGDGGVQTLGSSKLRIDDFDRFRDYVAGGEIHLRGCNVACGPDAECYIGQAASYSRATVTGYKGDFYPGLGVRIVHPFDWFNSKIIKSPQSDWDPRNS